MIAEVIINRAAKKLDKGFDYKIPKTLEEYITVGSKVLVPFGSGTGERIEEGFVIKIKEKTPYEVKEIKKLEGNLKNSQIELARWMGKKYFCNVSECIKLMQTPGTRTKEKKIQEKKVQAVYLNKDCVEIEKEIEIGKIKSEKQKKVINLVKENEGITIPEIELLSECTRGVVKTLEKNGYLKILEKQVRRDPLKNKNIEKTNFLKLTEEQEEAYKKIKKEIEENRFKEFLLFGITGSRKNRNIFTINKSSNEKTKNSNSISTRNIINTTNAR